MKGVQKRIRDLSVLLLLPAAAMAQSVTSEPFDVVPAPAHQFVFVAGESAADAGETVTFTVEVRDEFGNPTTDHGGFADIVSVSLGPDYAAGFTPAVIDVPAGEESVTFDVCFRMDDDYELTASASGMAPDTHAIEVRQTIIWGSVPVTTGTYMQHYAYYLYSYDPAAGPILGYSATCLPAGLSVSASLDLINTIAGSGDPGHDPSAEIAVDAPIGLPEDIASAPDGSIYFTDTNNGLVKKVLPDGTIETIANGFAYPGGIAIGPDGDVYVAASAFGEIFRLDAGDDYEVHAFLNDLDVPMGLTADDTHLYIAEPWAHRVLRSSFADPIGDLEVYAGISGAAGYDGDGPAAATRLSNPSNVALDIDGNLYIADAGNNRIRKVEAASGIMTTIAGSGDYGFAGDARLGAAEGISVDSAGRIIISDTENNRIRLIRQDGVIETIAGQSTPGFAGDMSDGADALLDRPLGVAVGPDMSILVADSENNRVRQIRLSTAILSGKPTELGTFEVTVNADPQYGCGVDQVFALTIDPKPLFVINATAESKIYDGTAAATILGAELSGVESADGVELDDVVLTDASAGAFIQDSVGEDIEVATAMTLTGADAHNYELV